MNDPLEPQGYFKEALAYTLRNEIGMGASLKIFTNDKADSGGPTSYGITRATLSEWRGSEQTQGDVEALTLVEATKIYLHMYWNRLSCGLVVKARISISLFDSAVLFGIGVTARYAQRALKQCGYPTIKVDGYIGVETVKALNALTDVNLWLKIFQALLISRVNMLTVEIPSDKDMKWRKGWLNRINRLSSCDDGVTREYCSIA